MPVIEKNPTSRQQDGLSTLVREVLGPGRLIIASNRGPLEHYEEEGHLRARRGSGGVVTALSAVQEHAPITWIASAMTEGDRIMAARHQVNRHPFAPAESALKVRFVVSPEAVYNAYYNVFSNPVLWFIQHQMADLLTVGRGYADLLGSWFGGYLPVNRDFANAIVREVSPAHAPVVMLHDYHLYLVPRLVRECWPNTVLQHFVHIPWPTPEEWTFLPGKIRTSILEGFCANDIVGFQTQHSAKKFLATCQTYLRGAHVDAVRGLVTIGHHVTRARVYPISIDSAQVRRLAYSSKAAAYLEKLRPLCGERTIVRVDRLDPSKNIPRGFEAFDLLLRRHPELIGKVKFLSFLVPSRGDIPEYQRLADEVFRLIDDINRRYARDGWRPIECFYENNYEQALAGMRLYDVLLVNPVQDGMNLVAKEGAVVNERDGVIVLSTRAGAYEQMHPAVMPVAPLDIEQTATTLYAALTAPAQKRAAMATLARQLVASWDISSWLEEQFDDLRPLVRRGVYSWNPGRDEPAEISRFKLA